MYSKPKPIYCIVSLLGFLVAFVIGVFLLGQIDGLSRLVGELQGNGIEPIFKRYTLYGSDSFGEYYNELKCFYDVETGSSGLQIIRRLLGWSYLFIFIYSLIGYVLILFLKLGNERVSHSYRKSSRLLLSLVVIASLIENSLLMLFFSVLPLSNYFYWGFLILICSISSLVRLYGLCVLVLLLISATVFSFFKSKHPVPRNQFKVLRVNRDSKNVVLFSDGTGNSNAKNRGTNVFRLYEALDLRHPEDPELRNQIAFYDDGVGTESNRILSVLGGAFGVGLSQNVKELYTELCRVYEPGDKIYLFGFSRGAFTVRTLSGMIANCGILMPNEKLGSLVDDMYHYYRKRYPTDLQRWISCVVFGDYEKDPEELNSMQKWFRRVYFGSTADPGARFDSWKKQFVHDRQEEDLISFLGVWDTVDAYGLPWDTVTHLIDKTLFKFTFPDNKLNHQVARARHALSIDDERRAFHPVLWDHAGEKDEERIQQVWFAGVHANVGGGYPRQGLSLISLNWMICEARKAGLRFIEKTVRQFYASANLHGRLYDSRSGFSAYYYYEPRQIERYCQEWSIPPKVHVSALRRIAYATEGYSPGNLPSDFEIVNDEGDAGFAAARTRIKDMLSSEFMLDKTMKTIRARQFSQYIFWITTLVVGIVMLCVSNDLDSLAKNIGWAVTAFVAITALVKSQNVMPMIPGLLQRRPNKMKDYYKRKWNSIRDALKECL